MKKLILLFALAGCTPITAEQEPPQQKPFNYNSVVVDSGFVRVIRIVTIDIDGKRHTILRSTSDNSESMIKLSEVEIESVITQ